MFYVWFVLTLSLSSRRIQHTWYGNILILYMWPSLSSINALFSTYLWSQVFSLICGVKEWLWTSIWQSLIRIWSGLTFWHEHTPHFSTHMVDRQTLHSIHSILGNHIKPVRLQALLYAIQYYFRLDTICATNGSFIR